MKTDNVTNITNLMFSFDVSKLIQCLGLISYYTCTGPWFNRYQNVSIGTDTRLLQLNPFRAVALSDIVSSVACMSWICSSNWQCWKLLIQDIFIEFCSVGSFWSKADCWCLWWLERAINKMICIFFYQLTKRPLALWNTILLLHLSLRFEAPQHLHLDSKVWNSAVSITRMFLRQHWTNWT